MKYQSVLQHSEEDCGAACLATIAKQYGRTFTLNRMREAVGTSSRGTTLLGLRRGAESLGFNVRAIKASAKLIDKLNEIPLPAIIHWKGYHWVVLHGPKGKKYVIADPAAGLRYLTYSELIAGWTNGVMLLLSPDETRFYQQESDTISSLGRFLQRAWPYRYILAEALAINLAAGLLALATPILMQILTDDVLVRGDIQLLTTVAIGAIALHLFQNITGLVQSHLIGHFAQRLQLGLILDYGYKLLRLPLSYFETRRSGEVTSRLADVNTINTLVTQVVLGLPSQLFIAAVSLGVMLFYSWQLTLAAVIAFLLLIGVNLLFFPALQDKTRAHIVLGTENQGFLVETFRGIQILKTTQATSQTWQKYQTSYGRLANLSWSMMKLGIYSNTLTSIFSHLTNIGILWFGSHLVINRTLTIGQLLAFNGMSDNFLGFLEMTVGLVDELIAAQVAVQRLAEVLDATPEDVKDAKLPQAKIPDNADIICTNLNFHHAGRVDLLKDFTLTIPGSKVTAIIGKSGCGKSTLAKLIAGLYPLQSGNIRYGMYNQQDLSLDCRRQQVVLVPQEAHFWSRSILENFRLSYPNATFKEIVRACQIAGADEFISELPDKYQTVLGEFGANLSGGQKQRLAIARGLVTNPPILILDESTSAIDPVSEAEVLDKLFNYRTGKTTIAITHRPSIIQRSDFIIFLEKGQLKQIGTLQQLRQIDGEHLHFFQAIGGW